MKTAAVIAEYNPFHNGHRYQLEKTRRQTGADFILAVMSGNFVQRGAPAIVNKYIRTKMALLGGVDAVIELPSLYALSSAEFFAGGAVTLLNQLGIVDILSFGSESGNLSFMEKYAPILAEHDPELSVHIKAFLKKGCSFPDARLLAIQKLLPCLPETEPPQKLTSLLSSPNNILGMEYCKALYVTKSPILPFTVKRKGGGYHETDADYIKSRYVSASAIRNTLSSHPEEIIKYVPEETFHLLLKHNFLSAPLTENAFSGMLYYKLLMEKEQGFSDYLDCTPDLSDKICRLLPAFTSFTGFCQSLKSKDLTYARISRVLMHILLNIKTPDFFLPPVKERSLFVPYARLLGFKKSASPLLKAIKKNSAIPLLAKLADAPRILGKSACRLLDLDIRCSCLYEAAIPRPLDACMQNEIKQSPVIIP